jgi:hypothetical protein
VLEKVKFQIGGLYFFNFCFIYYRNFKKEEGFKNVSRETLQKKKN